MSKNEVESAPSPPPHGYIGQQLQGVGREPVFQVLRTNQGIAAVKQEGKHIGRPVRLLDGAPGAVARRHKYRPITTKCPELIPTSPQGSSTADEPAGVAETVGAPAYDPDRKTTALMPLSAEVTTDVGPRAPSSPRSEIRMVRSRQPDPLAVIMFDWVLGADLLLPWRALAPIGDADGERRRKHVRVLHRQFNL
jgi:hypothetical protein